jgi:hypothetical protein
MNIARFWPMPVLLITLGSLGGCSSSGDEPAKTSKPSKPSDTGTTGEAKTLCPVNPTGFPGDEMCIEPPKAAEGFQLHYGPSDYDDPDELAKFTLMPGQETDDCFFEPSPNDKDIYYGGYDFQMRAGSHHLIGQSRAEAVEQQGFGKCEGTDQVPSGLFAASQTPVLDARVDPAMENAGLARLVPAHTQAVLNFHVINSSTAPSLREAWMNYYYAGKDEVMGMRGAIDLNGGLGFNIAPGTHKTYKYSCSPTENIRVLSLASHMHAHAKRMTIYKASGGKLTKLLESYSWEEPAQFLYDSAHTIKAADPVSLQAGGDFSGDLYLTPADSIQWECDIDNDSDKVLTFRNEVYTGEMCLVGGSTVNSDDPMTLTDFTCTRN